MQHFRPKLPRNYPEVGANGTRTHSMLTDQALLQYSEMATNRNVYVRTIRYITRGRYISPWCKLYQGQDSLKRHTGSIRAFFLHSRPVHTQPQTGGPHSLFTCQNHTQSQELIASGHAKTFFHEVILPVTAHVSDPPPIITAIFSSASSPTAHLMNTCAL